MAQGITERYLETAYENWRASDVKDVCAVPSLTYCEKLAVLFGNFNYQVENGGLFQWWDNGYAFGKAPNGVSAHVAIAAVVTANRAIDPRVADAILAAVAFIDPVAELEKRQNEATRFLDEDDDDYETPLDDHFFGEKLSKAYYDIDQARRIAFFDEIVGTYVGGDPFDVTFTFPDTRARLSDALYPEVRVKLSGEPGDALAVTTRVMRALKHAGVPEHRVAEFKAEALSGDYDALLRTAMRWVDCE